MGNLSLVFGLLAVLGMVYFFRVTGPRQQLAVALTWLFPGVGHFYLGRHRRGLLLGGVVLTLFVAGMWLADFRNVSPFERHPIWGLAHAFGGLMTGIATVATSGLQIRESLPFYSVGCLYSGVATLLNLLLMIDVWDLAQEEKTNTLETPEESA